jgi:hypothetical protein
MLKVDETTARRLVLVQAVETADEAGALLGEAERSAAERAVLQRRHVPRGQRPDPAWYLPARADELLGILEKRDARLAALAEPATGWDRFTVVLPVLALFAGFASELVGDPHKLDLVSLPLIGFALWNLAVYVMLLVGALARGGAADPLDRLLRWSS